MPINKNPKGKGKSILFFPGSFKPPHEGHLQMVKHAIEKLHIQEIWILISKKPRSLEHSNSKYAISAEQSKEIWKIYIRALKKEVGRKYFPKINLHICEEASPVITLGKMVPKEVRHGKEVFVMKSVKNLNNKRFNWVEKRFPGEVHIEIVNTYKEFGTNLEMSSTHLRYCLFNKPINWECIDKYIPKILSKSQIDKVHKILLESLN